MQNNNNNNDDDDNEKSGRVPGKNHMFGGRLQ